MLPSNFHLLGPLNKHMGGKQFAKDANMKQGATSWLQALDTNFYYVMIHDLMQWGGKCLNDCGVMCTIGYPLSYANI